jgi:hypothetical protein
VRAEGSKVGVAEGSGEGGGVGMVRGGRAADELREFGAANAKCAEEEKNLLAGLEPQCNEPGRKRRNQQREPVCETDGTNSSKGTTSHLQDWSNLCRRHISHSVQEPPSSAKAMIQHFDSALQQTADLSKRMDQALEVIHLRRSQDLVEKLCALTQWNPEAM